MTTTGRGNAANMNGQGEPVVITEEDIIFNCPTCGGELVVDRRGSGMTCPCLHCGQSLVVPDYELQPPGARLTTPTPAATNTPPKPAILVNSNDGAAATTRNHDFSSYSAEQLERRLNELKHQLKENQSQDTEMRGHLNRATMELHRFQLKLKKLQERQMDIESEIAAARAQTETKI